MTTSDDYSAEALDATDRWYDDVARRRPPADDPLAAYLSDWLDRTAASRPSPTIEVTLRPATEPIVMINGSRYPAERAAERGVSRRREWALIAATFATVATITFAGVAVATTPSSP